MTRKYRIRLIQGIGVVALMATLVGASYGVTITGTNEGETIMGGYPTDDVYDLLGGDDKVYQEPGGDDTYTGGLGNDELYDKSGNDTYIFNLGDGHDTVGDTNGADTIRLGEGIRKSNTAFSRVGDYDVVLSVRTSADSITLLGWFLADGNDHKMETIKFTGDVTPYTAEDIEKIIDGRLIVGTDGIDTLSGDTYGETIAGYANTIIGYGGDDLISGGKGDDTIIDEAGNEEYRFTTNDGKDTISDGGGDDILRLMGFSVANGSFAQDGQNMVITFDFTSDQITIIDWYGSGDHRIEQVEFDDGLMLFGTDGGDTLVGDGRHNIIVGYAGDDMVAGKGGDDSIIDEGGNEHYTFGQNDGIDVISDGGGEDTIRFEGFSKRDVNFVRDGRDLVITFDNTTDGIRITDWYLSADYRIEHLEFDDGTLRDFDGDSVPDVLDNCELIRNADQADEDDDGVGDVCEVPKGSPSEQYVGGGGAIDLWSLAIIVFGAAYRSARRAANNAA